MSQPNDLQAQIETWREDAAGLSYEEALQALDLLLSELQSNTVPLAELQQRVVHGEVYLDHCESLLKSVERIVDTLDPDSLEPTTDA